MEGLKILGLKMAQRASGSGSLYGEGDHPWECGTGHWMVFLFCVSYICFVSLCSLWKVLNSVSLRKDRFSLRSDGHVGRNEYYFQMKDRTLIFNSFICSAVRYCAYPLSSLKSSAQRRNCFSECGGNRTWSHLSISEKQKDHRLILTARSWMAVNFLCIL